MHKSKLYALIMAQALIGFTAAMAATPIVKVFSYEEVLATQNLSKPRIYIQNLAGSVPISNFYYYYYFTTENNKSPVLEDYYTPNSVPTLEILGNNNYRIKFTFLGITLQPGQILPNASGEVIGIRYTDWSPLDKTNDHSNNMSTTFALNPNIPVFLADGTQIYGNLPPNPANPPQPPIVYGMKGDYAIYSEEYTDLRDRVKITGGNVGSLNYLELGCDDTIYGSALSKGNIFLRERARIYGDVTSGQVLSKQNSVHIQGSSRNYAKMELPVLPTPSVNIGVLNIPVSPGGSYTLVPGAYNSFHAYANVSLTIQPGEYSFREFILETNVSVLLNVGSGDFIDLKVRDNCSIGNGTTMSLPAGVTSPFALSIHSAQASQLNVGTGVTIKGLIYAPDAEVHVYSRTTVAGSIYGRRVVVEPSVTFCKPPALVGLSHSEGAMAPPFDPMVFKYVAVVPDVTSTITVTPVIRTGQSVTVNGNRPSDPVNLAGTETDIAILLTHPEACGNTTYKLKVTRSANFAIYVDPNSPCTPGTETGTTWYSAWKKIEDAIRISTQTGQQICLREGIYKPTVRTNPSDSRSATFSIPCGTKIVGGFIGTETDGVPLGSPYNTVLSGDINGDDGNCTNWPPSGADLQYVDDNVYHTVTVDCNPESDITLYSVMVERGYANGTGSNGMGAGIYVKSGKPVFEFVGVRNNVAATDGAGMFVPEGMGISVLRHCLFQNNVCVAGNGAGLCYLSTKNLSIESSVFDANKTQSSANENGGSALNFKGGVVELVTCVFNNNNTNSILGAVLNNGGTLSSINNTFAFNTGNGAVSICNINSGTSTVQNCILWNTNAKNEVSGDNFTITYSNITNGYSGTGNFTADPKFLNPNPAQASGNNARWGDYDDGLLLTTASPCRFKGDASVAPSKDILDGEWESYYGYYIDIGAFSYVDGDPNKILGKYDNTGSFISTPTFTVLDDLNSELGILLAMQKGYHRCIQAELPKNKYTDPKNSIVVKVSTIRADNSIIGTPINVTLYRIGTSQLFRSYYISSNKLFGKPIVFTNNSAMAGEHSCAYVILGESSCKTKVTLDKRQFN